MLCSQRHTKLELPSMDVLDTHSEAWPLHLHLNDSNPLELSYFFFWTLAAIHSFLHSMAVGSKLDRF